MHPLFPYSQNSVKIIVSGSIARIDTESLKVTFELMDPRGALQNGPEGTETRFRESELTRAHELWKDTCFELFWSEVGKSDYYECNVSAGGKWNIYHFDSYRNPVPPQEATAYRVTEVEVEEGRIAFTIASTAPVPQYSRGRIFLRNCAQRCRTRFPRQREFCGGGVSKEAVP